jgi:hypothetical protein
VPDLELSWKAAAVMAGGLAACAPAMRRARRPRIAAAAGFTRETALVLALIALWQFAASHAFLRPQSALARGDWLWRVEQVMHLPSEAAVQHVFLPHPLIVQAFNLYYAALHFPVLMGCMIWLFLRHRERYRTARTTLIAFTTSCLLIQLIPVAPPRMLPATGMVDTAERYGQSVYAVTPGFEPNQLSAMPSVHVGWAILAAILVIETARSQWRWLALAYPPLTLFVVAVTANHFWLDGIVAAVLLAAVLLVQRAYTGRLRYGSPPESGPVSEKVDAGSSR